MEMKSTRKNRAENLGGQEVRKSGRAGLLAGLMVAALEVGVGGQIKTTQNIS